MNIRNRILYTAGRLCQQLLLPLLVTVMVPPALAQSAQQPAAASTAASAVVPASIAPLSVAPAKDTVAEPVTLKARQQEYVNGVVTLSGDVEADLQGYTLRADRATYDDNTGTVTASGGVVLDGGQHDLHLEASHAVYNVKTGKGIFYDVNGSLGTRLHGQSVVLTSNVPFLFTGREVEKLAGDHYIVRHGSVTSCQMETPMWSFNAAEADVTAGDQATLRHATFRLHSIPLFYLPYATHPVDSTTRHSGFLMPVIGNSSTNGLTLGDSFYWAINRSMDATIGGEFYSSRGWSQRGEFRARPTQESLLEIHYFGVLDRGINVTNNGVTSLQDQSGEELTLNGETKLPHGLRGVANIDYLSSFLFRAAFSESYTQAIDSEAKSSIFLSKTDNGFSLGLMAERYQNFQLDLLTASGYQNNSSMEAGNQILALHVPSFDSSTIERRLGNTPLLWSFNAEAGSVSRREPDFVSNNLFGRFDIEPNLVLPVHFGGWTLRAAASARDTYYTQQKQAGSATSVGLPINSGLNRRATEGSLELRPPAIERIFAKEVFGFKFKHVIEPRLVYHYTGGVDDFANVIRIDERDILSDTSELEAGIVQRFYAKPLHPKQSPLCAAMNAAAEAQSQLAPETGVKPGEYLPGTTAESLHCDEDTQAAREVLSWEIKQRYYFNRDFGGSLVNGDRNVLSTTEDFSAIAFLEGPRRWSPIVSRLIYSPTVNIDLNWELDYDTVMGRINSSTATLNYRVGEAFVGGSHAFLRDTGLVSAAVTPPNVFNQYRVLAGYGHPGKPGLSAGASVGFDQDRMFLQYSAAQASYNWDCCGVSFEYRVFSLGTVRKNEHQYRFTFSLLNVGTFGNLRKRERLY